MYVCCQTQRCYKKGDGTITFVRYYSEADDESRLEPFLLQRGLEVVESL